MSLVGPRSLEVILDLIVKPSPIIVSVYAYPRQDAEGKMHLAIHIISDDGHADTVVSKLCSRARHDFVEAYEREALYGLELFKFFHSGPGAKIPERAQLLYLRPSVPVYDTQDLV